MSDQVNLKNTIYLIPANLEEPNWGESLTSYLKAIAEAINSISGPSDLIESSFTIDNNISSPTDVTGFFFDSTTVRSFAVRGNITRQHGASTFEYEEFTLVGLFEDAAGWKLQREGLDDAGVDFTITSAGQVQYTSTNLAGSPYSGILKYRGIGILTS